MQKVILNNKSDHMTRKINGEEIFQIINVGFSVSPSNEGYTLQYSADGNIFTDYDEDTPSNETLVVTGLPLAPLYFRLKGNNTLVTINY